MAVTLLFLIHSCNEQTDVFSEYAENFYFSLNSMTYLILADFHFGGDEIIMMNISRTLARFVKIRRN